MKSIHKSQEKTTNETRFIVSSVGNWNGEKVWNFMDGGGSTSFLLT